MGVVPSEVDVSTHWRSAVTIYLVGEREKWDKREGERREGGGGGTVVLVELD